MNILQDILIPFISSSPQFKSKIENLTGQPVDHVMKCIRNFQDELKKGGGIKDLKIEQQEKFKYLYESGLAMGFTPWESEIAAAGCAGYSSMDVCLSLRKNGKGWEDITVEEVETQAKLIAPRFKKAGIEHGLFKPESDENDPEELNGIPKINKKNVTEEVPWRKQQENTDSANVNS